MSSDSIFAKHFPNSQATFMFALEMYFEVEQLQG